MSKKHLVLVAGNKRSGSTHISRLMNLHPKVFVSNETSIMWILHKFHNDMEITTHYDDSPKGLKRAMDACGHVLSNDKSPYENFIDFQQKAMKEGIRHWSPMDKKVSSV